MKLDANTLLTVGQFLDKHDIPAEDRTVLCVIEGVHYRLDEAGCWRFIQNTNEAGWAKCAPPAQLQGLF